MNPLSYWRHRHTWSKWKQYEVEVTQLRFGTKIQSCDRRQRRACEECGKEQDVLITDYSK